MKIIKRTISKSIDDQIFTRAAAMAYYSILSIVPLTTLFLIILSLFPQSSINVILGLINPQTIEFLVPIFENVRANMGSITLIGLLVIFFGATSLLAYVQKTLNFIWGAKQKKKSKLKKLGDIIEKRIVSFIFMFIFLILAFILITYSFFSLQIFSFLSVFIFFTIVFSIIFKYFPDKKTNWKKVIVGGAFTSLLFLIGQVFIESYIRVVGIYSSFGIAGFIFILLIWAYYSSIIFILGAEFTHLYIQKKSKR